MIANTQANSIRISSIIDSIIIIISSSSSVIRISC